MDIKAFVLNLPRSKDRWDIFRSNEAPRSSIKFERVDGIYGGSYCVEGDNNLKAGIIGCVIANRNLIELAKLRRYNMVLVLEDDAQLCDDFDRDLQQSISELPDDWCILRLHPSTDGSPVLYNYSQSLNTVKGANGTYGWVINSLYYDRVIDILTKNLGIKTTDRWGTYEKTFDLILREYQHWPFFETKKQLVYHADGHSDRLGCVVNYGKSRRDDRLLKIFSTKHMVLHARMLCDDISSLGYNCQITDEVKNDGCTYIMYNAFMSNVIPKNYIVYQCEQYSSQWFTPRYLGIINGAAQVWEFSENGMSRYGSSFDGRVFHVPAGLIKGQYAAKSIPVLFYGSMNDHRMEVIRELKAKGIGVFCAQNIFGQDILNLISRSKVVLNIHFYKNAHLETFRINEALSCGCIVVSENSEGCYYPSVYDKLVMYGQSINDIIFQIKKAMQSHPPVDLSMLSNKKKVEIALNSYFSKTI
jgi:GR25 family glycosyltransferase involved in LPS biosynthesis